jgi:guanylate kinase
VSDLQAKLFVIAAPSGAGKTTLVQAVTRNNPDLRFSISYTTRPQRRNEADGVDYMFVDEQTFVSLRDQGEMLESATVFDNLYGTSRAQVEAHLHDKHSVILEIDWQGARQVRESMPECVSIFILPPSHDELVRRLKDRGTDSEAVVTRRLDDALKDMSHWDEFDYVVINDDLDDAVVELQAILDGRGEDQATSNEALRRSIAMIVSL